MLITKSLYQSYSTRDFQGSSNHRQRGPNRICQRPAHRSKYLAYHGHDEYRIELESIPGLAIFIDFRKAYDCTVDWNFPCSGHCKFITLALVFKSGSESFIPIVPDVLLTMDSHRLSFFKLERGVRQGCPLSGSLFVLCAEVLANATRNDNSVKGIKVHDK